jgi:hypothetical protein
MSRKLIGMLSLLLLAGVLSGVSYASPFPSQITFGPSPFNSVTFTGTTTGETVTFSGVTGPAFLFNGPTTTSYPGTFSIGNATVALLTSTPFGYSLAPNALTFNVTLFGAAGVLDGLLTLEEVSAQGWAPEFLGHLFISNATNQFPAAGFNAGMTVDTDFTVYLGRNALTVAQLWQNNGASSSGYLSAGEVTPDSSVPEPGTIALMGTGLLGLAGYLRRRL